MRILLWHVHGSWTTAFVQGDHEYVIPVLPDRGPDGRGRARTFDWPASVTEATPDMLREIDVDIVLVQRPHELEHLCEDWLARRPGLDVPCIYVEHNAPQGRIGEMRHPAADREDVLVAHVTHFNELFWDCGAAPTTVIEHGIVDPGHRYTGELPRQAIVINEARRRGRVTGTDLLPRFAQAAPIDLFGMDAEALGGFQDAPQARMLDEVARRRVYTHPIRWTSLGLSLLEAMHLGMPVVALATTEAIEAVPAGAGVLSTNVDALVGAVRAYVDDSERAAEEGAFARETALARYGLERFINDWDATLRSMVVREVIG